MIEYITYKKKKYPVRVSYFALKHMSKETGGKMEMTDIGNMDIEMYEALLFFALQAGARAADVEFKFKREEMELVLDECLMEFVGVIPKFFPKQPGAVGGKLQRVKSKK